MSKTAAVSPITTDVLIVGAGPAGCAAAITLAQAGREVLLIDQHHFPRDKTCGDGLIPDSMQALEQLGVLADIREHALAVKGVACQGPKGQTLIVPAELAVLPRTTLDHLLVKRAQAVGATFNSGLKFVKPLKDAAGRVCGASVRRKSAINASSVTSDNTNDDTNDNSSEHFNVDILANWTILATGACVRTLQAADHCTRAHPSAMALRAYVYHPNFVSDHGLPIEHLHISWHKSYAPGYGWIFPCPDGVYNVGVGLYGMHESSWRTRLAKLPGLSGLKPQKPNLAELFRQFTDHNPMAKRLIQTGTLRGDIKGAPLRCSLEGAKPASAGLLVTGEAMGSTYALTGEGIGKAMETGILCGQALLKHTDELSICQTYEQMLKDLSPKFAIYQKANKINRAPWLIDLAIARGNKSPKLVKRMSLVLEEKANPARLFSLRGAWKFLTE